MTTPRPLIGTTEAAVILGISSVHVLHLVKTGKLTPALVTARGVRLYDPAVVERLKADRAALAAERVAR